MNRKERAALVKKVLDEYYPNTPIPLTHYNPFTLLIAVLLSAQCTDKRVNLVTPQLFAHGKTAKEIAKLTTEEIKEIIKTCGLGNSKAKAIKELSEILVRDYNGEVPQTFSQLEALPGVGHKTASVVMAQAFKVPAFPVDTHIHRCAKRWGLSGGKNVVQTERDLKNLFNEEDWIKLHLQIIYFAREYCPAKGHDLLLCPICSQLRR